MEETIEKILTSGKGILAADESLPTIKKRFEKIGIESTEDSRRAYRQMLLTTPGMEQYISGVILFDETIRQATSDGKPFPKVLEEKGIVTGIKVDLGTVQLPFYQGEKMTQGLDGLRERLGGYYQLGARFSKWRAVITIGDGIPSAYAMEVNSQILALYASLSQEANMVPIVEPEVLMDGNHDSATCEKVTIQMQKTLFEALSKAKVKSEYLLLKSNMVVTGKESQEKRTSDEIAQNTLRALKSAVPLSVPGIVFLSGGLEDEDATTYLAAIVKLAKADQSLWKLTFSYGRALQNAALTIWAGKNENVVAAQTAFLTRAKTNGEATL
jgi:fructose-bisphosphate aldolase class I